MTKSVKRAIIFGILAVVVAATLIVQLWPDPSPFTNDSPDFTVAITFTDYEGRLLHSASVGVRGEATVFELTRHTLKAAGIGCSAVGAGASAYIQGIGELYEFDHGPTSGWVYYVDGENMPIGSGAYTLTHGCTVEWVYALEPVPAP